VGYFNIEPILVIPGFSGLLDEDCHPPPNLCGPALDICLALQSQCVGLCDIDIRRVVYRSYYHRTSTARVHILPREMDFHISRMRTDNERRDAICISSTNRRIICVPLLVDFLSFSNQGVCDTRMEISYFFIYLWDFVIVNLRGDFAFDCLFRGHCPCSH